MIADFLVSAVLAGAFPGFLLGLIYARTRHGMVIVAGVGVTVLAVWVWFLSAMSEEETHRLEIILYLLTTLGVWILAALAGRASRTALARLLDRNRDSPNWRSLRRKSR